MKQCSDRYADMLPLRPPVSTRHARMDRVARGAQFAPFAALTGYDSVIQETGRLTEREPALEDNEIARLDGLLRMLSENPDREGVFLCFVPDKAKAGGSFVSYRGRVTRVDSLRQTVLLSSGEAFPIAAIYAIEQGD